MAGQIELIDEDKFKRVCVCVCARVCARVCVCMCVLRVRVCVCSVFGHISYRSDWELVKVDFRQSFSRQCTEEDYEPWTLTDLQVHTHTHSQMHMVGSTLFYSYIFNGFI